MVGPGLRRDDVDGAFAMAPTVRAAQRRRRPAAPRAARQAATLRGMGIDPYPVQLRAQRTRRPSSSSAMPGWRPAPRPKTGCASPAASGRCATAACSSTCTMPRARSRSSATRTICSARAAGAGAAARHRRSDRRRGPGPAHAARRADGQRDRGHGARQGAAAACPRSITASPISSCATASAIST